MKEIYKVTYKVTTNNCGLDENGQPYDYQEGNENV